LSERSGFSLSEYDETIRMVLDSGGEFRIYPKGRSMLPLIRQGKDSAVLVKPSGFLKAGDIAFYLRDDGHYVLHRVIESCAEESSDAVYVMCGDNQCDPERGVRHGQIIGRVSRIYRGDKPVGEKSIPYRLYLFVWRSFFIRRIYFKLRRLKNGV